MTSRHNKKVGVGELTWRGYNQTEWMGRKGLGRGRTQHHRQTQDKQKAKAKHRLAFVQVMRVKPAHLHSCDRIKGGGGGLGDGKQSFKDTWEH